MQTPDARRQTPVGMGLLLLLASGVLSAGVCLPASAGELAGRVTARGRGVRSAVVFIDGVKTGAAPRETVVVDQRQRTFKPHVSAVMLGTTVLFPNHDTVFHNVFSYREGKRFDLGLYPVGSTRRVHFDQPGLVKIYCNIHSTMSAFIWVLENPYFAVTEESGSYRIAGIPAGLYTVRVWHEKLGERTDTVRVAASGVTALDPIMGKR
jgi:plastocyanin